MRLIETKRQRYIYLTLKAKKNLLKNLAEKDNLHVYVEGSPAPPLELYAE